MKPLLFTLHAAPSLVQGILADQAFEQGKLDHRQFPDGESYIRLRSAVKERAVIFLCSLDRPDERLAPLLIAADAARRQGASKIGLIAPYLAYMRQDRAFRPGEAVSAETFASILSLHFDWLVTLEPHLHRIASLDEIFGIPAIAARATEPVGNWIAANVERPFLIGPDRESAPWIERIAAYAGCDFAVLDKVRTGDRDVRISGALGGRLAGKTPVVIDDIVSSGATMEAILAQISQATKARSVYIAVHVVSERDFGEELDAGWNADFVSCNSVLHPSNRIDIAPTILAEIHRSLDADQTHHRL